MNERIQELIEQAGLETQPAKLKIYKNDDGTVTSGGWEYPLEKFAKLIVRECANICFLEAEGHSMAFGEHCGIVIKEHFGVE